MLQIVVMVFVLVGCSGDPPEPPSMIHQILSAIQIPETAARDTALVAVCRECTDAGDIESVLLGLPKIDNRQLHDETADYCVRGFVAAGKIIHAERIIEQIDDSATRTNLSKLLQVQGN